MFLLFSYIPCGVIELIGERSFLIFSGRINVRYYHKDTCISSDVTNKKNHFSVGNFIIHNIFCDLSPSNYDHVNITVLVYVLLVNLYL